MKRDIEKPLTLDEGACIYGAGILLKHVQALNAEIAGLLAENKDIEFIHRARVASRRLRAALPLFESCLPKKKSPIWIKHIRNVTRALGEARDTDVQIDRLTKILKKVTEKEYHSGILRLTLRLRQHRQKLQPDIIKAVKNILSAEILSQMELRFSSLADQSSTVYVYTPVLYQHSFNSITARLTDLMDYELYITQPEKVAELHEMRIRAKWLRYTMETFSTLYSSELEDSLQVIRKIQDLLGEIHDCDVWVNYLPIFLEEERLRILDYYGHTRFYGRLVPGIEYLTQNRQKERSDLYENFVARWQEWREQGTWDLLRQAIHVPFPHPDTIYPAPIKNNPPHQEE